MNMEDNIDVDAKIKEVVEDMTSEPVHTAVIMWVDEKGDDALHVIGDFEIAHKLLFASQQHVVKMLQAETADVDSASQHSYSH